MRVPRSRSEVLRARIAALWRDSRDLDVLRERLRELGHFLFVRCDECGVTGKLEPDKAPAVPLDGAMHGQIYVYGDCVPGLGFFEGRRSTLRVLCLGCLTAAA